MPYKDKNDRDYKGERQYDGRPDVKEKRALRNQARYLMVKAGKAKKGDGKDVDHKQALSKGGTNKASNLRVVDASDNRSFKRNKDHSVK